MNRMFYLVLLAERNALTGDRNLGWFFVVAAVVVFGGLLIAVRVLAGKKVGDDDTDEDAILGDEAVEYPKMPEELDDAEPFGDAEDIGGNDLE